MIASYLLVKLTIIFLLHRAKAQNCAGVSIYEKSTGVTPTLRRQSDSYVILSKSSDQKIAMTSLCGTECMGNSSCIAYTVDYTRNVCIGYLSSLGSNFEKTNAPRVNLFQKLCIKNLQRQTYNRACPLKIYWTFEMVGNFVLDVPYNRTVQGVATRKECMGECLMSGQRNTNEPICRSASYNSNLKTCALSTETRFTRPNNFRRQQFTDYLENQCSQSSPASSCTYKPISNKGVISIDSLSEVSSIQQCQEECDTIRQFVCRSLEFQIPESLCLLSGDNTDTLSGVELPNRDNSIYRERECVTESCINGIYTYEKMTSTTLLRASIQSEINIPTTASARTEYCLQQCNLAGVKCPAIYVAYIEKVCWILGQNSQGRNANLEPNTQSISYFEKVCLRGENVLRKCKGKAWAFERVVGYEFNSRALFFLIENSILSRRDCEELCLSKDRCRSASYNLETLQCSLSEYTRRSRPNDFKIVEKRRQALVNYLENTCVEPPSSCRYKKFPSDTTVFSDYELQNVPTEKDCENICNTNQAIICRSFAHSSIYQQCYISGDDTTSAGRGARAQKSGISYNEKDCDGSISTTTQPTTSTSSRPPDETCRNGILTYEKMTGTTLTSNRNEERIQVPRNIQQKTDYCLKQCSNKGRSCPAVRLEYATFTCRLLEQNSQGRSNSLSSSEGSSYYEKICLQGANAKIRCSKKAWAYERVLGYQLRSNLYYKTEMSILTRQRCEEICIESSACKSALYESDSRECRLSAYTRRTNPSDYIAVSSRRRTEINYLENLCIPAPTSCNYNQYQDSKVSYPDSVLQNYINDDSCKRICDQSSLFQCRSYSFHKNLRTCLLSSEDTVSAGRSVRSQQFGSVFTEKSCARTTPTTSPPTPDGNCKFDERTLLEKIVGYTSRLSQGTILYKGSLGFPGITNVCKVRCDDTRDCKAFVIYNDRPLFCWWFDTASSSNTDLIPKTGTTFFNKICVKSAIVPVGCNSKLWAFQRYPNSELPGIQFKETFQSISRIECMSKCFSSRSFICRSALYNRVEKSCKLSEMDRFTANRFELQSNYQTDYIENNCILEKPICNYMLARPEYFMSYSTKSLRDVTYQQCLSECNKEPTFNCLSISYLQTGYRIGTCNLNSENELTTERSAIIFVRGSIYRKKSCKAAPPSTTTPPPATCQSREFTFEKLNGYDVQEKHQEVNTVDENDLARGCANECLRLADECDAFVLMYSKKTCYTIKMQRSSNANNYFHNQNYYIKNLDATVFRKICLPENKCLSKLWTYDRVLNFQLIDSVEKELSNIASRVDCERACQSETGFKCTSANYFRQNRQCQLNTETRRTFPTGFRSQFGVDYLENQCIEDSSTCQYKAVNGFFMKFVDKILDSNSEIQCRQSCETEPKLPCRSFSFDTATNKCYLGADDTWSRPEGKEALLSGPIYLSYVYVEKKDCEKMRVTCNEEAMVVSFTFNEPFNGMIYAKPKPKECFVFGKGTGETILTLPLGSKCGTVAETQVRYVNDVIVQKHRVIQTSSDRHVKVVCSFKSPEQILTYGSNGLGRDDDFQVTTPQIQPITSIVTNSVPPPPLQMTITDKNGQEGHVVGIGDILTLRIQFMNPRTTIGMFVRNLTAETIDNDNLILIDINGCPVNEEVFPALKYDSNDGKSVYASFKAFRFPTSGYIKFKAQLHFCQDNCKPVNCANGGQSVGRRRRENGHEENEDLDLGSGMEDLPESIVISTDGQINQDESILVEMEEATNGSFSSSIQEDLKSEEFIDSTPWNNKVDDEETSTIWSSNVEDDDENDKQKGKSTTPETETPFTTEVTSTVFDDAKEFETSEAISSPSTRKLIETTTHVSFKEYYEKTNVRKIIKDDKIRKYNGNYRRKNNRPNWNSRKIQMPQDTPVTYSLLVSPDEKDYIAEDRALTSANLAVSPKSGYKESFSVFQKDEICSDRTTVIASILTVVLVHVFAVIGGLCYFKYHAKRKNKSLEYAYTAAPPLPDRNNSAGASGILGRPNMTFRNIYGYITTPGQVST